jgi:hypothetical protein
MFQSYGHLTGWINIHCLMYYALCHPHLSWIDIFYQTDYPTCHIIKALYYIHILIHWGYTLYQTSATYNEITNMATVFPIRFLYLILYD